VTSIGTSNGTTIGFIGSGRIGSTVASLAIDAGYDVVLSNSRGPATLADVIDRLGPKARAATAAEAASAADIAVVSVPFNAYESVPVEPLAGKVVIDTNNYYPQRDGQVAVLDEHTTTSAGLLQAHLPTSKVVKAFNHIESSQLASQGRASGAAERRALAVAGDDPEAKTTVSDFLDEIGYDAVDLGVLAESWRIEPGTPGYGPWLDRAGLLAALAAADRG
jgi:predicted dinucleotide-binding enzyme